MTLTREVLPVNRRSLGHRLIAAMLVLLGVLAVEQCGRSARTRLDRNLRDWPMASGPAKPKLSPEFNKEIDAQERHGAARCSDRWP